MAAVSERDPSPLLALVRQNREVRVAVTMPANPHGRPLPPQPPPRRPSAPPPRAGAAAAAAGRKSLSPSKAAARSTPVLDPTPAAAPPAALGPAALAGIPYGRGPEHPRYAVRVLRGDLRRPQPRSRPPDAAPAASGDLAAAPAASSCASMSELGVFERHYRSQLFAKAKGERRALPAGVRVLRLPARRTAPWYERLFEFCSSAALLVAVRLSRQWIQARHRPLRVLRLPLAYPESWLPRVFDFCDRPTLIVAVRVSRVWALTVRAARHLRERMLQFAWSGEDGPAEARYRTADPAAGVSGCYDGLGIVHYFGTGLARRGWWENPAKDLLHPVKLYCSARHPALRRHLTAVLHRGVAHFETDALPHSWVAMDFGEFRVCPTWYTIGSSAGGPDGKPRRAHPVAWQLLGAEYPGRPDQWEVWDWTVLGEERLGDGEGFSDSRLAMTFPVRPAAAPGKAFRFFRLVQTSRNQHFGHAFQVSGFEVYGYLRRARSETASHPQADVYWGV
eukprot:TRINITY_DN379_c0_g1_i1.p1 TRINITY_DN379_c0_g1~~TRINITY_DN379_c0_g1_i1.p1  ORF type:complete len:533 (+),score=164.46 TRINITY_DN379_c0_g1_i1:82-1599(+)